MGNSKINYQKQMLKITKARGILYNPDLANVLGSVNAGVLLSQLLYWWNKGAKRASIYKSVKELQKETFLTKSQQLTAQNICVQKSVLLVSYKRIPQTRHFTLCLGVIETLLDELKESREHKKTTDCLESEQLDDEDEDKLLSPFATSITESTYKDY